MPLVTAAAFGQAGVVLDQVPLTAAPEALTIARNVRLLEGSIAPKRGEFPAFGSTPAPALWLQGIETFQGDPLLIVGTTTKLLAYTGTGKVDVTRALGPYSANENFRWNGGILSGVPVANNFIDLPQAWPTPGTDRFVNLPAWPGTYRCRVLRPFKQFLVALNISKGALRFPFLVKWSSVADPGALPGSWDETDQTNAAGEAALAEDSGEIVDGVALRDVFIIYKHNAVWGMQFTGSFNIFRFYRLFNDFGALGTHCVLEFNAKHFVVTNDDIVVHDGNQYSSVGQSRVKRWFFNNLNTGAADKVFVMQNLEAKEIYICFPSRTSLFPDTALVYNWAENAFTVQDIPELSHGANVRVPAGALLDCDFGDTFADTPVAPPADTWDSGDVGGEIADTWEDNNVPWDADIPIGAVGTWNSDSQTWNSDTTTWDEDEAFPIGGDQFACDQVYGDFKEDPIANNPFAAFLDDPEISEFISASGAWDTDANTWDSDESLWDDAGTSVTRKFLISTRYDSPIGIIAMATSSKSLDVTIPVRLERTHLVVKQGELVPGNAVDLSKIWLVRAGYLHFLQNPQGQVRVYIAKHMTIQGEPEWIGPFSVDSEREFKFNCLVNTRLIGIRVESENAGRWRFSGITLDLQQVTRF